MAEMTTLMYRKPNGTVETYGFTDLESATRPAFAIVKRKPAVGKAIMNDNSITFFVTPVDADGAPIQQKLAVTIDVRYPTNVDTTSFTNMFTLVRDFIASSSFDRVGYMGRALPDIT